MPTGPDTTLPAEVATDGDSSPTARLCAQIDAIVAQAPKPDDARAGVIEALRAYNAAERETIAAGLAQFPYVAKRATTAYTELTDQLIRAAWHYVTTALHPNPNPTASEQIAVLAVGGYGRAEMAPFSDVDLLFLTPYKQTAWGESAIESMLYLLWDLKLKVGQAVRTVDECIRLGQTDLTIRTALLEHRHLTGACDLSEELYTRLWDELFLKTGPQFVEAKLEERENRHNRNGGSRYLVEPNVKEGKGGLRDLQTLFWIAKYLNHAQEPEDLVRLGVFTAEEMNTFRHAENFLWAVRCQMHLAAGRAAEQLTFDLQVDVADRLGFVDTAGQRAVERFMQTYFTYARQVGELTRIFLVALEAEHVKKRPSVRKRMFAAFSRAEKDVPEGYVVRNGRIDVVDHDAFQTDPLNILRLFRAALSTGFLMHPDAMRRVTASLHLIDDSVRENPEANAIFLELLLDHNDPERALRRMNEMGVLGAFIPEFGRIVAMMQFNMYHHYTVDEHTIQCIHTLFSIEKRELVESLPVASRILERGVNRRVLYVALFLHDIGKGRPEDHSELGAEIAERLCPRLGLPEEEVETVVWLVRHHLLMSDFAQKRDLADARTVRDFAAIVKSPTRLNLLTVLTVCDIRGVGPGVWNNWKAMLLRELYALTRDYLTGDTARISRPERIDEAKAAFAAALPDWSEKDLEREKARHYASFWLGLTVDTQTIFAKLIREVTDEAPAMHFDQDVERGATRVCFALADHPGLFSRLAGALALAGANVVDARTYTTSDGLATPVFWIQDKAGQPYEDARLTRLKTVIRRTLAGEVVARDALAERDRIKKREQAFIVPTEITFDNDGSEIYTMITVDTRDRPGLLYDLSRTLTAAHMHISSAIIATYGEQAVDTFYVKDSFGLKITSKPKQKKIATLLRDAIRRGAERAEP
ncbi:[protein-PII] uridylyltransferase [Oceanibium sediminis]|uniref:[protein-PII] uridylyltransferase n=1 Tax=Oceanibium sediminis TaxID=2026339 RepID=UPI000DD3D1ED|nr:[protein-PII] uridylyltransferase [Oceanibium sediminis]